MAFKMKGNPYKMCKVKTKQTMAYMKSPLEQSKPDYIDIDKDGDTTESMKEASARLASMAKMKSPMMQIKSGTCAVCSATREQHNVGKWNEANHAYTMGQAESVQSSKDERKIEMAAKKEALIKKYGSMEAAIAANEAKKAKEAEEAEEGKVTEAGLPMKSPLEQKVAIGTTPADKKEYDREVGDYIRQSAIVKGSKKAEKLKKRRLAKEAKAAKGPKKGINIDFRKTKSNKRGTGGKIGIRLIPKITRKGRGINFN